MMDVSCPLCGSVHSRRLITLSGDKSVRVLNGEGKAKSSKVFCLSCGMVYQNPQFDEKEIKELYAKFARSRECGYVSLEPSEEYLSWKKEKAFRDAAWIQERISFFPAHGLSILDIGCAEGSLLSVLKDKGWKCFGIEPTLSYAEFGRARFGLDVRDGLFEDSGFAGMKFDLITAMNVLEHSRDPAAFLLKAKEAMRNDGYLCLEVPNVYKPRVDFREFIGAQHIVLFSPRTISAMIEKCGLRVVALDDSGVSLRVLVSNSAKDAGYPGPGAGKDSFVLIAMILYRQMIFSGLVGFKNSIRSFLKRMAGCFLGKERAERLLSRIRKRP